MRTKPKAFKLTDIMIEPKPVDRRLDPARANRAPRGPEKRCLLRITAPVTNGALHLDTVNARSIGKHPLAS